MTQSETLEKNTNQIRLILTVLSAIALFTLYLYFVNYFFAPIFAVPMNSIESAVFYTMILRALALAFVPFLKKIQVQVKIVILSLEDFVLCFLILGFVVTGQQVYNSFMAEVLTAWLGATLIVLTPYFIYEFALMMYKGTNLTSLFLGLTPLLAVCLFLSSLSARIATPPNGLANFGGTLINSLRGQPGLGVNTGLTNVDPLGVVVSTIIFLMIIIYVVLDLNESVPTLTNNIPKYRYALAFAIIGMIIVCVWIVSVSPLLKGNVITILSVPTIIVPVILWVMTREQ